MRSINISKLAALTLSITLVVLFFKSGAIEKTDHVLRNLVNQTQISAICLAAQGNFSLGVAGAGLNASASASGYFQLSASNSSAGLISYVKTGDPKLLQSYGMTRAAPYIIFIAFAIICLIGWFFYCGCCIRPCLCCKKGEAEGCFRFVSLLVVIACYVGIVIGCIIGYIYAVAFVNSLNGTTCAFLVFYSDVVSGQNTTTTPRWIGISNIATTLQTTQSALDTITANFPSAFSNNSWTNTDPPAFVKQLQNSTNSFNQANITNPNPAKSKANGVNIISPKYITNWSPYNSTTTELGTVYTEFQAKIQNSIALLNQTQTYSYQITQSSNQIKNTLSNLQTQIGNLSGSFNTFSGTVLDNLVMIQTKINSIGILAFYILFAVFISFAVGSGLCLLFYVTCCKVQFLRYILHLVWVVTITITILTFILGGVFGIVALISQDGTPVLQYIFSTQNLLVDHNLITDPTTGGYLDTCINNNGDLATRNFNIQSGNSNVLDQLYQVSLQLASAKALITSNTHSLAVAQLTSTFNGMIADITLTTDSTLGNNDVNAILTEWQRYTDNTVTNTYQTAACPTPTKDFWTQNKGKCLSGYNYVAGGGAGVGATSCLVYYNDWTNSQTVNRAPTTCTPSSPDFSTFSSADSAYWNSLNNYITSNSALLNQLNANIANLDASFVQMSNELLVSLNNASGVVNPLINIFQSIVGNNGLFQLINCGDLNILFNQMQNNLGPASASLAGAIIAVSFLEMISIFFLLIVIFRYREDPTKEVEHFGEKSGIEMHKQN